MCCNRGKSRLRHVCLPIRVYLLLSIFFSPSLSAHAPLSPPSLLHKSCELLDGQLFRSNVEGGMGSSARWLESRWEGRPYRCVGHPPCLPHLLTHTSGALSSSDGFRYYISHHRTGKGLGMYDTVFVSSLNADWCPWLPSPDGLVFLRADGTYVDRLQLLKHILV